MLVLSFCSARVPSSSAQATFTQEELRSLPRVCLAQKFINGALSREIVPAEERKRWASQLGPSYLHFHHFCYALIYLRRAASSEDLQTIRSNYAAAVDNFAYVQRNATSDFPMLPEVYLRKGMALQLLSKHAEAAEDFAAAIRLNPDYTPAYAALVDVHLSLGDVGSARAVLDAGLRRTPDSAILAKKRLDIEGWLQQHRDER